MPVVLTCLSGASRIQATSTGLRGVRFMMMSSPGPQHKTFNGRDGLSGCQVEFETLQQGGRTSCALGRLWMRTGAASACT
jgi:hypothetical protein